MEKKEVCGTCLKKEEFLFEETVACGRCYVTFVCLMCRNTLRKIRTFHQQCSTAAEYLREYSSSCLPNKTWEEFCQIKNVKTSGLGKVGISKVVCINATPSEVESERYETSVTGDGDKQCVQTFFGSLGGDETNKTKCRNKRKRKMRMATVDGRDDISLKELFKIEKGKSDKGGERQGECHLNKENENSNLFNSKIVIKQEDGIFEDPPRDEDREELQEKSLHQDQDLTELINEEKNSYLSDADSEARGELELDHWSDIVKVVKTERNKSTKVKDRRLLEGTDIDGGLLMLENILSREEQMEDMLRRKQDADYLNSEFKCESCGFGFNFQYALDTHMKKHSKSSGEYECWLCQQRFRTKSRLGTHTRCHHTQKMWCGLCGRRFYNKTRLRDHVETHRGFQHKCATCSRTFQSRGSLVRHTATHRRSSDFKCQYCSRVLKSQEGFKSHMLLHLGCLPYACAECPEAFAVRKRLNTHILRKHRPPTGQHYCVECDFQFKTSTDYKSHLSTKKHTHPTLLKFACMKCPRRYATEVALNSHTANMHERVLKYSCSMCPAQYATTQGLSFHRRKTHEGYVLEKKYPCVYCQKGFTSKTLLENHLRTHTGEQPFQCGQCGRAFSQRCSMKTHIRLVHDKKKKEPLPEHSLVATSN